MNIHSKLVNSLMKTILITGAASGLGKATAILFAQRGWHVLATMRAPETDANLAAFPNLTRLTLDVTDPAQIAQVVAQVTAGGGLDVLFNNAGYILVGPLEGVSEQQLLGQINTNLMAPIRITQAFLPHFRQRGSGTIINTTSLSALIPDPFFSVYVAAKAGLEQWSHAMRHELKRFNIAIKTIVPGVMRTGLAKSAAIAASEPYAPYFDQLLSALSRPEFMAAGATPESIAEVVFQAATDGKDQVRYVAGTDAQHRVAELDQVGIEALQQAIDRHVFTQS